MKKQGNKNFLKPVITNSNVAKETNPVKVTTFVEVRSKSSRSTETEKSLMKNQVNLIPHLYFQNCFS